MTDESTESIGSTLKLVLNQLQELKEDRSNILLDFETKIDEKLNAFQNEVQGNSLAVYSEVKKLKLDTEHKWSKIGNKVQYTFNSEVSDSLTQTLWALQHSKTDYAKECLNETIEKLKQRNKLIKLTDTSEGGWETVRQYSANPIASDSDDESKIKKAVFRALQVVKRKNQKKQKLALNSKCAF
ncbi:hypothetical protein LOTGIDRAFT_171215 [Lottia gigantea]|uniref:Uncharacterized protein n=1 Tax=Lottia gigantea TaxID=225164 RepID=V4B0L3_LOTGI|nr:hypothetical protein LOTGIDRAFT_171215 [Lottia gigantea]ESP03683.1 hypothetical protein LOTGIDRAFT_171215 [Lottia gigantea]